MGCVFGSRKVSTASVVPGAAAGARNADIDRELLAAQIKADLDYKILLLGAGESGKSTVVKQLQMLYTGRVTMKSSEEFARVLRTNTIVNMQLFIRGLRNLGYDVPKEFLKDVKDLTSMKLNPEAYTRDVGQLIGDLWKHPNMKEIFKHRNQFYISGSAEYCFDNAERFAEESFSPTWDDIMIARIRTTGMLLTEFDDGPMHWRIVDVGGQRSERKKWISFLDNVSAVWYVVDLSAYNSVLFEDDNINAMQEALELFEKTMNNPAFRKCEVFLFLNKQDLFLDKLQHENISCLFGDYKGETTQDALDFIAQKFQERITGDHKISAIYYGTALDKSRIKQVFEEIRDHLQTRDRVKIRDAMRKITNVHNR